MGCTWATVFMSSRNILALTSDNAWQEVKTCMVESKESLHRGHAGLIVGFPWESLSFVMKSQVRNFKWRRSFLASCVVSMFWSAGCARPVRPYSWTFRKAILELFSDMLLSLFSCQEVILVLTRVSHCILGHAGVCSRDSGGGSPYFILRSWIWLAQVVELLLHIFNM